jgi:hypothetical protein
MIWRECGRILGPSLSTILQGASPDVKARCGKKTSWTKPVSESQRQLIKKKHRLWSKLIKTKDLKIERQYKKVRNQVRKESRKLNVNEQKEIAKSCKSNPKSFWKYVRDGSGIRNGISHFTTTRDGVEVIISEDIDKANALVQTFSKVFMVEPDGVINNLDTVHVDSEMLNLNITEDCIRNKLALLKLDKSPRPDNLHPRVLYERNIYASKAR